MDPGARAVSLPLKAERVVEVLRLLRVDGAREEPAEIDAIRLFGGRRRRHGRVLTTRALVPEQSFEDGLDVVRAAEDTLEARPAGPETEDDEIADGRIAGALAVDDDGPAAAEVRLADEELAAAGELADRDLRQVGR